VIPPAFLFLLSIALAIGGSLVFPNELYGRFFNLCDEYHWDFDGDFTKHVDCFWQYIHFYYVDSTNP
jgi:hypothetical protein